MPRRLFVRSGGGMPGLDIHAGIWCALHQDGIAGTDCWGTSAGAIVSALDASGFGPVHFTGMLRNMRDGDVRWPRLFWKLRAPWLDSYLDPYPIRRLFEDMLPADWDGFQKGLRIYATNAELGISCNLAPPATAPFGPALACLASMAISGAFPPVRDDAGHEFVDGGVTANLPAPATRHEIAGYDEVWLLVASGRTESYQRKSGILTRLIQNARWLMRDQLCDTIDRARTLGEETGIPVRVIWPDLPAPKGVLHFDHELIDRAAEETRKQLATQEKER